KQELSQMHQELGEVAINWHQAINYKPSQEAYEKLVAVYQEKNEIDERINTLKNALNNMSTSDRKIEQTKLSMKELDKRYNVLISSLGAVAIEIDAAGKLPLRLEKCLEPMREYEKKLDDCNKKLQKHSTGFASAIYEKKLEKLKNNLDEVFTQTGHRIYNSGNFREVPGQRAKAILDEMEQIRFAKKNYKNDILDHKNMIDEAQGSLVSIGAYGEENRKLRELQNAANVIADRLSDHYTSYGQVLADGLDYWIDVQAPEELKQSVDKIIRQSKKIAVLSFNYEHLIMEKDIDIHNMQITKLSEQMNHLVSQIQAIENQKAELQSRMDVEFKAISELKMKQSEISAQIAQIK
ncbi:MAG: hypothetical protein HUK23_03155, partial [Sphaerochaetaceae bacterium]|nr:hypothetical protein [Sphaerochaetaceae bacterium]